MMRRIVLIVVLAVCMAAPGWTTDAAAEANLNFLFGEKKLDDGDWGDQLDEQTEFGFMFDFKQDNWPVAFAFDFLRSSEETEYLGVTIEGETMEFNAGMRGRWWSNDVLSVHAGFGLAFITAELTGRSGGSSVTDDGDGLGFWADAGLMVTLSRRLNFGVDLRYSYAEAEMFDYTGEVGGFHALAFVGLHF